MEEGGVPSFGLVGLEPFHLGGGDVAHGPTVTVTVTVALVLLPLP
jgi:hypothetical protein